MRVCGCSQSTTLSLAVIMPSLPRKTLDNKDTMESFPLAGMELKRVSTTNPSRTSPTDNRE